MKISKSKKIVDTIVIFLLGFVVYFASGIAESSQSSIDIEQLNLPEDTTPRLAVRQISITGNTLIPTDRLLKDVPLIFNNSDKPLHEAESNNLYDFRILRDIILNPGETRQLSTRTIEGFTQYILSIYQSQNYSGVYVHVPAEAISPEMELPDGQLPVEVIEAPVSEVKINYYDVEGNIVETEKELLRRSVVQEWSPVKEGEVANKKKMDDFINLLNLNPDRYISATVSAGAEPRSLAVGYDIYEGDPWHFYVQVDNSGTKERRWAPRVGVVNTNLTGRDDKFSAMYQAPWESGIEDNYMIFGSYDFPVFTPRLRLNLYGGYSEFDISGPAGIDFLGSGSVYGGILRFNALQKDGWFFDLLGSLRHEKSKVTPSLFPQFLGAEVEMNLWGVGFDIHRSDDMSNTSFLFNRFQSFDSSSQSDFTQARTNADRDFTIITFSAAHRQFLDSDKIQRLLGSFRYIRPNARLVPAKMTAFGGLYSVRGYEEYEIVADGGMLWSLQYEYDLVKLDEAKEREAIGAGEIKPRKPWLRKLAPLVFFDNGRAKMKDRVAGEKRAQELSSIGGGMAVELGDNFSGAVYYGVPLRSTDQTDIGDGRFSFTFVYRF
jgi:hemolysin activation/secretion protein